MQVVPDPPVEVGKGVGEDGLPPTFIGAEGVEAGMEDAEEDAVEEEETAEAEEDPEPVEEPVPEPPEANAATDGPGKVYENPGL